MTGRIRVLASSEDKRPLVFRIPQWRMEWLQRNNQSSYIHNLVSLPVMDKWKLVMADDLLKTASICEVNMAVSWKVYSCGYPSPACRGTTTALKHIRYYQRWTNKHLPWLLIYGNFGERRMRWLSSSLPLSFRLKVICHCLVSLSTHQATSCRPIAT